MDSTFLRCGLGIRGQDIIRTEYAEGIINIHIRTKSKYLRCSVCGSESVSRMGISERSLLTAPVGLKSVRLVAHVQRLRCHVCGKIRQEKLSYADAKKSYTYKLEDYVASMLRVMTVTELAKSLGMSWNTVKDIRDKNI